MTTDRPRRRADLDGLRAVAVVAVLANHAGAFWFLPGGGLGVDIFFVLSGFLITSLLLKERISRGSLSFGYFYARRALRLFPALATVLAVFLVVSAIWRQNDWSSVTLHHAWLVVVYSGNWSRAFGGNLGLFGHTWSLAVEEQFYLVWPAVTVLLVTRTRSRRTTALFLLAAAIAVMIYRLAALHAGWGIPRVSNGIDTHCDGLLIGAALAYWVSDDQAPAAGPWLKPVAAIGAVALLIFMAVAHGLLLLEGGYSLAEVVTALMIWSQLSAPIRLADQVLTAAPMRWIGRRSYGLYLWHFPYYVIWQATYPHYRRIALAVVVTFISAAVSYRYIEMPALRLKARFEVTEAGLALPALRPGAARQSSPDP